MKTKKPKQSQEYTIRSGPNFATLYAPSGAQHSKGGADAAEWLRSEYAAPGRTFIVLPFDASGDSRRENW